MESKDGTHLPGVLLPEHAHLRELARTIFPRPPSTPPSAPGAANLDIPLAVRLSRDARPIDAAALARIIAGLERKNDALREELSQCRERVRLLADTVAAQTKRIAELQAPAGLPDGVVGDPDWTPPRSLLPRGMR